jgi:hypothetical protein
MLRPARVLDPFRCVLITVAGWMNQRQMDVIDYLREENRVLREQLGQRPLRLNRGNGSCRRQAMFMARLFSRS